MDLFEAVHVSDLHIDKNTEAVIREKMNTINSRCQNALLLITGDITNNGSEEEYCIAHSILSPFCGRIMIVPGNHDFGFMGNFYEVTRAEQFDDFMRDLGFTGRFCGVNKPLVNIVNGIRFIGLDTNLETGHPFDFACGEVGDVQLEALKGILNGRSMTTVLYFHHHPFERHHPFMQMRDAKELMRAVYGRVDVMLFGHKHEPETWIGNGGIRLISSAGTLVKEHEALRIVFDEGELSSWGAVKV